MTMQLFKKNVGRRKVSGMSLQPLWRSVVIGWVPAILLLVLACVPAAAQLNQSCVVSVLTRNVQVNADGTWVLPNIPANFGPVTPKAHSLLNPTPQLCASAL